MDASKPMRIVILGKTGSGKSSLANTLFGQQLFTINHTQNSETEQCQAQTQSNQAKKKPFTVGHTLNSETKECQSKTDSVNGREITLIDTPGFFDTNRSEEKLMPEIVKCITECSPGPHAFLVVLKVEKYTDQEKAVIDKIHQYFSEKVFKYATVLFTHGDQLPEGQTIQEFVPQNELMSDLVKKCGGRCHVFDNKYWNKASEDEYRSNRFQVEELLKTIDKTVEENQGGCYTNEMLQAVEESIRQEQQRIRERSGNMSEEEIREQAKVNVCEKLLITMAGVATGTLLGALFGVIVMVGIGATLLSPSLEPVKIRKAIAQGLKVVTGTGLVAAVGTAVAVAGKGVEVVVQGTATVTGIVGASVSAVASLTGAVGGGKLGYDAAEGAETAREAAKKTVEAVRSKAQSVLDKTNKALNTLSMTETEEISKINDPTESGKT